jgi:hypothetical protein
METSTLHFDIKPTDHSAPLTVTVHLDQTVIFGPTIVADLVPVHIALEDDAADHELKITLSGKTADHTKLDDHNNIVKDAVIEIANIKLDDIDIQQLFVDKSVYHHNTNNTTDWTQDRFYGIMGCNGTVSMKFSTPSYLWLLENM